MEERREKNDSLYLREDKRPFLFKRREDSSIERKQMGGKRTFVSQKLNTR